MNALIPKAILVALCASLLAAPATAGPPAPSTGPYVGTATQGESDSHLYDNNPTNQNCIQIVRPYTVTLQYAPTTDALTLSAAGYTATGSGGTASVTFLHGVCTSFTITVTGTSVAGTAAYAVEVTGLPPFLCCLD